MFQARPVSGRGQVEPLSAVDAAADMQREAGLTGLQLAARRTLGPDDMLVFRKALSHNPSTSNAIDKE